MAVKPSIIKHVKIDVSHLQAQDQVPILDHLQGQGHIEREKTKLRIQKDHLVQVLLRGLFQKIGHTGGRCQGHISLKGQGNINLQIIIHPVMDILIGMVINESTLNL